MEIKQYRGRLAKVLLFISVATALYHIYFNSGINARMPTPILMSPHLGLHLGLILLITFFIYPATRKAAKEKLPWYDVIFMVMGVLPSIYYFLFYEEISIRFGDLGEAAPIDMVLFIMLTIALLEAGRRVAGPWMSVVTICFFIILFFPQYLPWILHGRPFSLERVSGLLYMINTGIWGVPVKVAATFIICFIIFSRFLLNSGAASFFINLAMCLFGSIRGGPAKVSVVSSAFFASLTGSAIANIVSTGTVTIPLMKRVGYRPETAGAIEAVASNAGHIMPPVMGAVAFVMAEFLDIPYGKLIIWVFIPAVLYIWATFMMVDIEAVRFNIKGLPRQELPTFRKTIKEGWFYLIPLVFLVILLGVFLYDPARSALLAILVLIAVSWLDKDKSQRMNLNNIIRSLEGGIMTTVTATVSCALAGIIIGSVLMSAVGIRISTGLIEISGGYLFPLVLMTGIACFILGMGLTSTPIYITLAVLVAPALVEMGVPRLAVHISIVYWGCLSFITPPVAIAAYAAASLAQAPPTKTGIEATRIGFGAFLVPFVIIYNPALVIYGSTPVEVVLTILRALAGFTACGLGIGGQLYRPMGWGRRGLLLVGGIMMMVWPGVTLKFIGLAICALIVIWEVWQGKKSIA